MQNLPVHWSEGMFLRPQHFQAADRYWTEMLQTTERWDHAYNYGLRLIELSHEALGNYQVQVSRCQARMKDGTVIGLDVGQEPDRVDLKEARSAIFNGAGIVVVNLVRPGDPWEGIRTTEDVASMAATFLATIE